MYFTVVFNIHGSVVSHFIFSNVYHVGSVEDRKYLRCDILNNQVKFNVILST